ARRRRLVKLDVGPANSRHFHLHQRGVVRNVRHREFAHLGLARACSHGRKDSFHHGDHLRSLSLLLASTPARSSAIYRSMRPRFLICCSMMPASTRVQALKSSPAYHEALAQVREWTRERFTLAADATILVTEITCRLPGCPP